MLDALYLGAGYLAGLFLIAIFLMMMALSLGREFGINVKSGDDIASWCMAALAFLGLAHTFKSGEMIRVGLLTDRLTGRTKWLTELLALILAALSSATSPGTRSISPSPPGASTTCPPACWWCRCGSHRSATRRGLVVLFIAIVDELVHVAARQQADVREGAAEDRRGDHRARRLQRRLRGRRHGSPQHLRS